MHRVDRRRGERVATAVLCRAAPAAAVMAGVTCLLAAVLVPRGWWRPELVWPLLVVCLLPTGLLVRRIPVPAGRRVPPWTVLACLAVAVAFTAWAGITHAEHVILRRDAGAYALYAQWIATRHGLPVGGDVQAFGGLAATHVPGFNLGSPAFYQISTGSGSGLVWQVTPQFLIGAPALYSLGWWLAGWTGVFWAPALLAGLGVLAFAGTAVRLVGGRWAVVATAALALTEPVLHTARATYSEPPALLLLMAASSLAVAAVTDPTPGRARLLGAAAGSLLGLTGLIRVDNLREVALLVPVCAVLALRRHPSAVPLAGAALLGTAVAAVPAFALSGPYLDGVSESLEPLAIATTVLVVLSVLVVVAGQWWSGPAARAATSRRVHRASAGAALLVLLAGAALALRPLWTVSRSAAGDTSEEMIRSLQRQQGLVPDGLRTYAERSVTWVVWYVGPVAVLAALLTFAALAAAAVRAMRPGGGSATPGWMVPAWVALGSAMLTLYRPGVTPDHPWADRRLVPVILPAVVLASTAGCGFVVRRVRARLRSRRPTAVRGVTGMAVAVLLVPAAHATIPLATARTEVGEPAAVAQVCAALRPGDVVAMVSDASGGTRAQNEWVQVVRGVCGRPAVALTCPLSQQPEAVRQLTSLARGGGHRLVLLAAGDGNGQAAAALTVLGTGPVHVAALTTREDDRVLTSRPRHTVTLIEDVWLGATGS